MCAGKVRKSKRTKAASKRGVFSAATLAGVFALLLIFTCWALAQRYMWQASMRVWQNVAETLTDALLVMLPYWWLRGRWRSLVLIPVWTLPLFLMANVLYYRQSGELLPFSSMAFTANHNEMVFGAVPSLLKLSDFLLLLLPILYTAYFVLRFKRICRPGTLNLKVAIAMSVMTVAFGAWGEWHYTRRTSAYWEIAGKEPSMGEVLEMRYITSMPSASEIYYNPLPVYIMKGIVSQLIAPPGRMTLDRQQMEEIADFRAETATFSEPCRFDFSMNKDKNLIFIIVESLDSRLLDLKAGETEVMPNLIRLAKSDGTVIAREVVSQVADGVSSDGLLMYNTGILPLRTSATAIAFPDNKYLSLATLLKGRQSVEVMGELATEWNHDRLSKGMGYDSYVAEVDTLYKGNGYAGRGDYDHYIFKHAAELAAKMRTPFLLEVTTRSMHMPYDDYDADHKLTDVELSDYSKTEASYLQTAHYFDRCLGEFIEALKRNDLYDKSVIVIASDHTAPYLDADVESRVLFMAVNTGINHEVERIVGQIDVFPTILDIMGVESDWRGVGLSMFNRRVTSAVDRHGELTGVEQVGLAQYQHRAWDVSEMMLRGDYFANGDTPIEKK